MVIQNCDFSLNNKRYINLLKVSDSKFLSLKEVEAQDVKKSLLVFELRDIKDYPVIYTAVVEGVDIFYPVGAIYLSTNETSPAEMFGGTWSALDDGRFLRPMGSYNQQGGSTTHNHWETVGFNTNETNAYMLCGRLRTNSRVNPMFQSPLLWPSTSGRL